MQIDGSSVLVTGGASGLGEATTRQLHALGAFVAVFDRDEERGRALEAELGSRVVFVPGDVLSTDDTERAVSGACSLGPLRGLVACAGGARSSARTVSRDGTPHDLGLFVDTVNLNLVGTFNSVRMAAAAMVATPSSGTEDDDGERGVIVTTASIAGYEGQIGQIAYASAKAGIIGMTLVAARDLAAVGIRVNCIAPGTIGTRAWDQAPPDMKQALAAKVPFPRRLGHPEEYAKLVQHLIENRYLNGDVIRLDGGIRFDPK